MIGSASALRLIVDTKRLVPDSKDRRCGVSREDLYQLFAYRERYQCQHDVLVFPQVAGAIPKHFRVDDGSTGTSVRIEFHNMNRDRFQKRAALKVELQAILHPA